MNENLACNLEHAARLHGRRPALRLGESELSYARLHAGAAQVAGWLRARGFEPGDRVGIMLPNVPEFALAYYGVLRAGGVVVPMNVLLKEREVAYYLGNSGAKLVFGWQGYEEACEQGARQAGAEAVVTARGELRRWSRTPTRSTRPCARAAEDTAVILYTSGTTGKPKGAELTHANLRRNVEVGAGLFSIAEADVVLGALPLFHSFGQTCGLNAAVRSGACLALVPRFDPHAVLETIERYGVTIFQGVPTMYAALLGHPRPRALRRLDAAPVRLRRRRAAGRDPARLRAGVRLHRAGGLRAVRDLADRVVQPPRSRAQARLDRDADRGVEMRLVDDAQRRGGRSEVGEIAIRGHNMMKGYWRRPDATAEAIDEDGWFYTRRHGAASTPTATSSSSTARRT